MDASPFGTLSGEIRNRIYHYFFNSQLAIQTHVDIRNDHPRLKRNQNKFCSALALTATSRQLRRETLAIFWSTASFRIVTDTLSVYSSPANPILYARPLQRADYINNDRAWILREWVERSGIAQFATILRPIEVDLGMWNPRIYAHVDQHFLLLEMRKNVQLLTRVLQDVGSISTKAAGCTLMFKVQVQPSTALGSIRVPNDRKQALAAIAELCDGRHQHVGELYGNGKRFLTRHGRAVLTSDIVTCRAVADLLVSYIVEEKQEEEEEESEEGYGGDGEAKNATGKKGLAIEQDKRSGD